MASIVFSSSLSTLTRKIPLFKPLYIHFHQLSRWKMSIKKVFGEVMNYVVRRQTLRGTEAGTR